MFQGTGKLIYDPHKNPKKRIIKESDWWLILKTDEGIIDYYKYWIQKHYNVKFDKTIWGSHISVVRGVPPNDPSLWGYKQGKKITFTYTNRIYLANEIFFCVDAYSNQLEDIREHLGYTRQPLGGFHITIGRVNKLHAKSVANDPFGFGIK